MKKAFLAVFFSMISGVVFAQGIQNIQEPHPEAANISLVVDYDLHFTAASYSNLDYTLPNKASDNIFAQYFSLNVIGKFSGNVEMSAKLASYGSSGKHNGFFLMPYERNDSSVFLETAFLTYKNKGAVPFTVYAGKQEITHGDGLIIDGNNNGLFGVRGTSGVSDYVDLDLFIAKDGTRDVTVLGASAAIEIFPKIEIGIYQERNNSGFAYYKGIWSEANTPINHENKTFYDIRMSGGNSKYGYKIEAAKQTGELVRTSSDTLEYDNFAFAFEGMWKGKILKRDSNAKLLFSYANADGENSFNSSFSRRYDGVKRVGHGELFAANNADSFLVLPEGYYGINTVGAAFDIKPFGFLQTGLAFYLYSASDVGVEAGDAGFASLYGAKADLGNEIDFFAGYAYKEYFDVVFNFAVYTPPSNTKDVFQNADAAYLLQIEVSSKF
ncbi:MAG: hypothetical protein LBR69_02210 [Endomicrobium sp.]|jgi:hypothetical protein|nr:hypothetical protein [Endomicrobium sp.]